MTEVSIQSITGMEVLDSRGNPTVEAHVCLSDGSKSSAAVPSGASTGTKEAHELRDGATSRYLGKGVTDCVRNINTEINSSLAGLSPFDQKIVDTTMIDMDGTNNKSRLGANSILAVSIANAKAAALSRGVELYQYLGQSNEISLPVPYFNILNGGAHANNSIDFQEFMVIPRSVANFSEALCRGAEIYHKLKNLLDKRGFSTAVGDEGGFAPDFQSNKEALDFIVEAIIQAGFTPGTDVSIALDVASSELYHEGTYLLDGESLNFSNEELIDYYADLIQDYPIVSIEDGMDEQDWIGWKLMTDRLGAKVQLVGDDLFVTNPELISQGVDNHVANSVLIKPNQVGTLTETLLAIELSKKANYGTMISHRSGETEDTTIADLAVAVGAGQIKAGAPCRSERVAKYNRLLRIEHQLGEHASIAQLQF